MKCKFEVGEKVKVLNKSGCSPWGDHCLSIGKEYTLTGIRLPAYTSTGEIGYEINGQTLQESEIELSSEWQTMVCVDNSNYRDRLTQGKEYLVKERQANKDFYEVCNPEHGYGISNRFPLYVFKWRFVSKVPCPVPPGVYVANAVCIDPGSNELTCGKEYYIKDSTWGFSGGNKFVHVFDTQTGKEITECYASRFKDLKCAPPKSLGSPACEVEQPDGTYIVWSSTSNKAPSRTYATHRQARRVAREMSQKHVGDFYVMRAFNKYSTTQTVNKETL